MGHFGPKMAHPNNFGSALSILLHENFIVSWEKRHLGQFLTCRPFSTVWLGMVEIEPSHCYYWIVKQSGHDFSGNHLFDGYCMDIVWCLCVEVKIRGFVKLL